MIDRKACSRLASSPDPLCGEEKGPGTHCTRMRKVYGKFSSIIRRIPIATTWSGGYGQRILST